MAAEITDNKAGLNPPYFYMGAFLGFMSKTNVVKCLHLSHLCSTLPLLTRGLNASFLQLGHTTLFVNTLKNTTHSFWLFRFTVISFRGVGRLFGTSNFGLANS